MEKGEGRIGIRDQHRSHINMTTVIAFTATCFVCSYHIYLDMSHLLWYVRCYLTVGMLDIWSCPDVLHKKYLHIVAFQVCITFQKLDWNFISNQLEWTCSVLTEWTVYSSIMFLKKHFAWRNQVGRNCVPVKQQ